MKTDKLIKNPNEKTKYYYNQSNEEKKSCTDFKAYYKATQYVRLCGIGIGIEI